MSTVVLITGANRGLGKGLLERYLGQPNHTVIAANRNPDHPSSKELGDVPKAEGSKLLVVKLDAAIRQDALDAVKTIESQGIGHLDIVVANAGVALTFPTVADLQEEDLEAHLRPNVYGFIALYQATRALLRKSQREPVLALMGSTSGSLSAPFPFPNAAYAPSKGMASWYSLKINLEEPWLNSITLNPGWVHTDLGYHGAVALNIDAETQTSHMVAVDTSCDGMFKLLGDTTKEKHGGKLVHFSGDITPW